MSVPKSKNDEEEVVEVERVGDMCEDIQFKSNVLELGSRIDVLGKIIKACCESGMYPKLSIEEKVKFDLFLSYTLTSLYWVYLRTQGENPVQIKSELDRIKKYMDKSKQIHDRKSMPRLDQEAAKRFVRSGLWNPNSVDSNVSLSKKRKHTVLEEEDNN